MFTADQLIDDEHCVSREIPKWDRLLQNSRNSILVPILYASHGPSLNSMKVLVLTNRSKSRF